MDRAAARAEFVRPKQCAPDPPETCSRLVLEVLGYSGREMTVDDLLAVQQAHRDACRCCQLDDDISTEDYLCQPISEPLFTKPMIQQALTLWEKVGAVKRIGGRYKKAM